MDKSPAAEVLRAKLRGDGPAAPRSPGGPTLAKLLAKFEDMKFPRPDLWVLEDDEFDNLAFDMMVPNSVPRIDVDGIAVVRNPQTTVLKGAVPPRPLQPIDIKEVMGREPPELTMPQLFEVLHIAATHRDDRVRDAAITLLNRALRF